MDFIRRFAWGSARSLTLSMKETHETRGVYYYGFQILYGSLTKFVMLGLTALILRVVPESALILLAFALLRTQAGGFHMDTYFSCLTSSTAMMAVLAVLAGAAASLSIQTAAGVVALTAVLTLATLLRYAPLDTPSKPIPSHRAPRLRRGSLLILAAGTAAALGLTLTGHVSFGLAVGFGLLAEGFSITPGGVRFFMWVQNVTQPLAAALQKRNRSLK